MEAEVREVPRRQREMFNKFSCLQNEKIPSLQNFLDLQSLQQCNYHGILQFFHTVIHILNSYTKKQEL